MAPTRMSPSPKRIEHPGFGGGEWTPRITSKELLLDTGPGA